MVPLARGCPHFRTASRWGVIVWQFYLWHVWSVTIRHVILYVTHSNVTFDSVNDICDMRYVTTGCHCQGNVVTWWSVATIVENVTWSWWPHGHMAWPLTSGIVLPLCSSWETRILKLGILRTISAEQMWTFSTQNWSSWNIVSPSQTFTMSSSP